MLVFGTTDGGSYLSPSEPVVILDRATGSLRLLAAGRDAISGIKRSSKAADESRGAETAGGASWKEGWPLKWSNSTLWRDIREGGG